MNDCIHRFNFYSDEYESIQKCSKCGQMKLVPYLDKACGLCGHRGKIIKLSESRYFCENCQVDIDDVSQ